MRESQNLKDRALKYLYRHPILLTIGISALAIIVVIGSAWLAGAFERPPEGTVEVAQSNSGALVVQFSTPTGPGSPGPTATFTPAPTPTPTATSIPTATPLPNERLETGVYLHRLGDFVAARSEIATLLNSASIERRLRLEARYQLAKSYLAEEYYAEALAALDQLDAEFSLSIAAGQSLVESPEEAVLAEAYQAKSQFLRGNALRGLGRYAEAITAYNRFLDTYPWMSAGVQPRLAQAYLVLGDSAKAAAAYRAAVDSATETVQQVLLLETIAQTYINSARYQEAVAAYDEILAVAQNGGYRAQIQYQAGQTLATAGDEAGAIARWRAATEEVPASRYAYNALIELVTRQVEFDLYQRGYIDLQAEAWFPAINAFQAYLESVGPEDSRAGLALLGIGQAQLGAGSYAAAVETFDRVLAEYPACECVGQAWIDKGFSQAWLGDSVSAHRTYRTFAREFPADPLAPEALWRSGLMALNLGNDLEATTDFLALADGFPTSERVPTALYLLGMDAFHDGRYTQTINVFTRLQTNNPDHRGDAVSYWLGRAYHAEGKNDEAQQQWQALGDRFPDTYYGVLAAYSEQSVPLVNGALLHNMERIAGPASRLPDDNGSRAFAEAWLAEWLQVDAATLGQLPPAIASDVDLRTGQMLLDLGERGDALQALERVYTRYKDDPLALYALSLEFERLRTYRLSLISMARLLEFTPAFLVEEAPIFLQQRAYPLHFDDIIQQEALVNDLDPLLFFSLVRQESLFEEGARSYAAAQGLAQIIPDTGAWVADRLGYPGYTNAMIYRPMVNIKFGTYYLDWVRDYLDGNIVSALVGYNAGPGNSEAWRAQSGPDDTLFVEQLTLIEPRIYVQAITSNLYHYTRLYGEN